MEVLRENPKIACGCCTTAVVLILALVGMIFSAGTVEPIAYGIKYNKLSKNVESPADVYDGGWYLIGPFNSFIQFPKT